jgi:hypothetical protein
LNVIKLNNSKMFTEQAENCNQKLSRVVAFRMVQGDYDDLAAFARLRGKSIRKLIAESVSYEIKDYRQNFKKQGG